MTVKKRKPVIKIKSSLDRTKEAVKILGLKKTNKRAEKRTRIVNEDKIRLNAYHRYLSRGCEPGRHEQDWYNAEKEEKARL